MDRVLEKKKDYRPWLLAGAGLVALVLLASAWYSRQSQGRRLSLSPGQAKISAVENQVFQELIPVDGVVQPIRTIYLDATESGQVARLFVEDGAILQAGDPILELENKDLELDLMNRETAVFETQTQLNNTRNNLEQNRIRLENQLAETRYQLAEAQRQHQLNQKLFDQKVIAEQEFLASQNNYHYQQQRLALTLRTLRQDSLSYASQMAQQRLSLQRLGRNLAFMKEKSADLVLRAPVAGQLTSLAAEIGEQKSRGQRLGQIDVLSGFKLRAEIDEHYLPRLAVGQEGFFDWMGQARRVSVRKVFSQVANNRFAVELSFVDSAPQGLRRGQSLALKLALGSAERSVVVPRGAFFQQTGGHWIYKLDPGSRVARKVSIRLGRQNPDWYEVLEGLAPGDQVLTSSYETFGQADVLELP